MVRSKGKMETRVREREGGVSISGREEEEEKETGWRKGEREKVEE